MEIKYCGTENPAKQIWENISLNITKENIIKNFLYTPKASKVENIRFIFEQAKELYFNSLNLSLKVSPLNQFYSFSLLAKILILIEKKSLNLESLKQSHGLSINILNRNRLDNNNIEILIGKNGTFYELYNIFDNNIVFDKVILGECFDYLLDAIEYAGNNKVARVSGYKIFDTRKTEIGAEQKDKTIDIVIPSFHEKIDRIIKLFPDIPYHLLKTKEYETILDADGHHYRYYFNNDEINPFNHEMNIYGNDYLIADFVIDGTKQYLNQIILIYIISFACSNLVRYYPDLWNRYMNSESYSWLLKQLLVSFNRTFPNYILDFITKRKNIFLNPGNLTYTYDYL
jgi:hypothetical protein